jgi:hypothetical protein
LASAQPGAMKMAAVVAISTIRPQKIPVLQARQTCAATITAAKTMSEMAATKSSRGQWQAML